MGRKKSVTKKNTKKNTKKKNKNKEKEKINNIVHEIIPEIRDPREIVLSKIRENNINNNGIEWARKKLKLSKTILKRDVIKIAIEKGLD